MIVSVYTARTHKTLDCAGLNVAGAFEIFKNEHGFTKNRCSECGAESFGGPRRLNEAHVRYDRKTLISMIRDAYDLPETTANGIADSYERVRREGADKPCQSIVYHGPGNQSTTYCQNTGGPECHDESEDGKVLHSANLPSGGFAEWTDDDPYSRDY